MPYHTIPDYPRRCYSRMGVLTPLAHETGCGLCAQGIVKLADFGVATKLSEHGRKEFSVVGTPYWMAPEVSAANPYCILRSPLKTRLKTPDELYLHHLRPPRGAYSDEKVANRNSKRDREWSLNDGQIPNQTSYV